MLEASLRSDLEGISQFVINSLMVPALPSGERGRVGRAVQRRQHWSDPAAACPGAERPPGGLPARLHGAALAGHAGAGRPVRGAGHRCGPGLLQPQAGLFRGERLLPQPHKEEPQPGLGRIVLPSGQPVWARTPAACPWGQAADGEGLRLLALPSPASFLFAFPAGRWPCHVPGRAPCLVQLCQLLPLTVRSLAAVAAHARHQQAAPACLWLTLNCCGRPPAVSGGARAVQRSASRFIAACREVRPPLRRGWPDSAVRVSTAADPRHQRCQGL